MSLLRITLGVLCATLTSVIAPVMMPYNVEVPTGPIGTIVDIDINAHNCMLSINYEDNIYVIDMPVTDCLTRKIGETVSLK